MAEKISVIYFKQKKKGGKNMNENALVRKDGTNITARAGQKEMAKLGDISVFIKRTENGAIKAVQACMKLEEKKGEIAVIQGKCMITAAGYNTCNKVAGLSIITPEKLTLPDGSVVVNPFPIIDKASGSITKVWVKKLAVGYSPIGNIVITSSTLLYDINMYFIQDLIKKLKQNSKVGKICDERMLTDEEKRTGIFMKIDGTIGIWANLADKDVMSCVETYVQNKLFAERKAQTICERNVMKRHPALSQIYVDAQGPDKGKTGYINIIGYTHDMTKEDLLLLASQYEKNEPIDVYKGRKVEVIEAQDEITDEDIAASRDEEEVQPEMSESPSQSESMFSQMAAEDFGMFDDNNTDESKDTERENAKTVNSNSRRDILLNNLLKGKEIIGDEKFTKIISENFNKPVESLTVGQLEMAMKVVNAAIDEDSAF